MKNITNTDPKNISSTVLDSTSSLSGWFPHTPSICEIYIYFSLSLYKYIYIKHGDRDRDTFISLGPIRDNNISISISLHKRYSYTDLCLNEIGDRYNFIFSPSMQKIKTISISISISMVRYCGCLRVYRECDAVRFFNFLILGGL